MKTSLNVLLLLLIACISGCSTSSKFIDLPFSSSEFQTNNSFVRGRGMGSGATKQEAQLIAYSKARETLVGQIKVLVEQQITEIKQENNDELTSYHFESTSKTILNSALENYEVLDQLTRRTKNGEYEVWIVIQITRTIIDFTQNMQ